MNYLFSAKTEKFVLHFQMGPGDSVSVVFEEHRVVVMESHFRSKPLYEAPISFKKQL